MVAAAWSSAKSEARLKSLLMAATAAGMKDWKTHIRFMQRNKLHRERHPAGGRQSYLAEAVRGSAQEHQSVQEGN